MIAKELYRLRQAVEKIEDQLKSASPEKQDELKDLLRKQRAELEKMQKMLNGAKDPAPYRKPL